MPSPWDHKADKDLLLVIIQEGSLSHLNWSSISSTMGTKGYNFTAEACRQHYQKIRKESNIGNGGTPVRTPNKITKNKSTLSSRANGKSRNASFSSMNEDDEEIETPTKRKRTSKKEKVEDNGGFAGQTAAQFKVEGEDLIDLDDDDLIYA